MRLGELLLAEGLLTPEQLQEALRLQGTPDGYAPLGHILIAQKLITRDQLLSVLERHRRGSTLGDTLLRSREITRSQLTTALAEQRRTRQPLGEVLRRLGYISEERLRVALCRQLHIRFFSLDTIVIDPTLRSLVSEKFAMKHRTVPVSRLGNLLVLAMDDPTQTRLVDVLQRRTGLKIEVITSTSAHITRALERLYRPEVPPALAAGIPLDLVGAGADNDVDASSVARQTDSPDAIVRTLLFVAVDRGASDIHLETIDTRLHVRFRIDGTLRHFDLGTLGDDLGRQRVEVLSRLKILAALDIAERRRPQDGSFRIRMDVDGRVVPMAFRVSLIPGLYGENAVVRVLDPRGAPDSVASLKMAAPVTERLQRLIRSPAGMILVTGPAGAGKSSTLLAILKSVYRPEIKVVTAEDPIEHVCPQFGQHEIDERAGATFAAYARSFLRHDPDVVMFSELRDAETTRLAVRAAQTGRLVLSTLHTSDALDAVARLGELGVGGPACTSALLGVLAQRLAREICRRCRQEYTPSHELVTTMFDVVPSTLRWYHGAGCAQCHHTGYAGRLALAELWTPGVDDVQLISQGAPLGAIVEAARTNTYSMATDALATLREGRTTLDELRRVLPPSAAGELRSMVV